MKEEIMRQLVVKAGYVLSLTILSALFVVAPAHADTTSFKKEFPRLGGIQIGRTKYDGHYANPQYQAELAKLDFAVIGGVYGISEAAQAVKAINPDVVLAKYVNAWNVFANNNDRFAKNMIALVNRGKGPNNTNVADWWARNDAGVKTSRWPSMWSINLTEFVQPNENGERWPEIQAKYHYDEWLHDDVWDFWYSDDVYWRVRQGHDGTYPDWNGRGTRSLTPAQRNAAFRKGHQNSWRAMRALTPGKMIMANSADWPNHEDALGRRDLPEYDQQVEGGLLENVMDSTRNDHWPTVITKYRRMMSYLKAPGIMIFAVHGHPTDYKFFRYTFATCLLNDGYFEFSPNNGYAYGSVEWFDEFDLAGRASTSWLGVAVSQPPSKAWQKGVWRRDFQNGMALVNPARNGQQTVTIENGFRRIQGVQDPAVNNGQSTTTITLQAGDGIVLIRETAAQLPSPPEAPVLRIGS